MRPKRAFTLIELLIVVAIISILSAIAVPNFLEAQTRSKIARAKADLRTLATGLEAYTVDYNSPPRGNFFQLATLFAAPLAGDKGLILLSTPVSYLTSGLLPDPFDTIFRFSPSMNMNVEDTNAERIWYKYSARDFAGTVGTWGSPDNDTTSDHPDWWILQSSGPARVRYPLGQGVLDPSMPQIFLNRMYDPTNGTVSAGSIYRPGGTPTGPSSWVFRLYQSGK